MTATRAVWAPDQQRTAYALRSIRGTHSKIYTLVDACRDAITTPASTST
jgi:hypothetical protein